MARPTTTALASRAHCSNHRVSFLGTAAEADTQDTVGNDYVSTDFDTVLAATLDEIQQQIEAEAETITAITAPGGASASTFLEYGQAVREEPEVWFQLHKSASEEAIHLDKLCHSYFDAFSSAHAAYQSFYKDSVASADEGRRLLEELTTKNERLSSDNDHLRKELEDNDDPDQQARLGTQIRKLTETLRRSNDRHDFTRERLAKAQAARETAEAEADQLRHDLIRANDDANQLDSQLHDLQSRQTNSRPTQPTRGARDDRHVREGTASTAVSSQISSLISIVPAQSKAIELVRGLENPSKYDGTGDFDQWAQSLELRLSNASFKTQLDAMQFIQSLLDGTARQLTLARMPSRLSIRPVPNPYLSAEDMLNQLSERFGTRDVEQRAMTELAKLKQKEGESFRDFYARYQVHDVYVTAGMPELARVMTLQSKLNYRYSSKVLDGTEYATERELADKCRNLDRAFETLANQHPRDKAPSSASSVTSTRGRFSRTTTAPAAVTTTTVSTSTSKKAPLPEKYRRLGRISVEEKGVMIKENRCFRCREKDCRPSNPDCPFNKYAINVSSTMVSEPAELLAANDPKEPATA